MPSNIPQWKKEVSLQSWSVGLDPITNSYISFKNTPIINNQFVYTDKNDKASRKQHMCCTWSNWCNSNPLKRQIHDCKINMESTWTQKFLHISALFGSRRTHMTKTNKLAHSVHIPHLTHWLLWFIMKHFTGSNYARHSAYHFTTGSYFAKSRYRSHRAATWRAQGRSLSASWESSHFWLCVTHTGLFTCLNG